MSKSRLTQVYRIYFSSGEYGASSPEIPGSVRWLDSSEQVWTRLIRVTEEWRGLDTGWIDVLKCSLMVLINERQLFEINPTQEEKDEAEGKIVEVSLSSCQLPIQSSQLQSSGSSPRTMFSAPKSTIEGSSTLSYKAHRLIYPGEHDHGVPIDLSDIRVRCRKGTTQCTLHLFPG